MNPVTEAIDRSLCYLMPYHKERDLKTLLNDKREAHEHLDAKTAQSFMLQLSTGLQHLHSIKLIHRFVHQHH